MSKQNIQIGISIISLLALLTYTLVHTGSLLARYVHPSFVGYVAAFGIEASVVSLSLRIGQLRKTKQSIWFFMFVLIAVVIVSAVANIAEGFTAVQGEQLTAFTIRQLDPVQAFIGLSATGLVSLIVLALSEIIGTDVDTAIKQAEREKRKNVSNTAQLNDLTEQLERARAAKLNGKERAKQNLLVYLDGNPNATLTQAGQAIDRSKTTVSNYVTELEQAGQLHKNGNGWQVEI